MDKEFFENQPFQQFSINTVNFYPRDDAQHTGVSFIPKFSVPEDDYDSKFWCKYASGTGLSNNPNYMKFNSAALGFYPLDENNYLFPINIEYGFKIKELKITRTDKSSPVYKITGFNAELKCSYEARSPYESNDSPYTKYTDVSKKYENYDFYYGDGDIYMTELYLTTCGVLQFSSFTVNNMLIKPILIDNNVLGLLNTSNGKAITEVNPGSRKELEITLT